MGEPCTLSTFLHFFRGSSCIVYSQHKNSSNINWCPSRGWATLFSIHHAIYTATTLSNEYLRRQLFLWKWPIVTVQFHFQCKTVLIRTFFILYCCHVIKGAPQMTTFSLKIKLHYWSFSSFFAQNSPSQEVGNYGNHSIRLYRYFRGKSTCSEVL